MSDLDRFEVFTHVVEQGSLTRAAELLGCTKAAISKKIKRLEEDYSINLFSRHKQRLRLTTEGEALYEQCLRLRKELEGARSICQSLHTEPEGDLHVVVFGYFAERLVFPRLKNFLETYPKVKLRIDTTERVPNFLEENIDLAVGFSLPPPDMDRTIQKRMATTRYVLCASPQYFNEFGQPNTLEDVKEHRYICHTGRSIQQAIRLKPGFDTYLDPYLWVNTVDSLIACARHDVGLIQLPLYMVDNLLQDGTLIEVLTEFQAAKDSVFCYYPQCRYMQPKVQKFMEFFLNDKETG